MKTSARLLLLAAAALCSAAPRAHPLPARWAPGVGDRDAVYVAPRPDLAGLGGTVYGGSSLTDGTGFGYGGGVVFTLFNTSHGNYFSGGFGKGRHYGYIKRVDDV
ncbi:hypothetical protein EVAR_78040_1 [Eumeta japonica]|uniref:Uncharacterized protein n=1 Tax=Eumeta variegata TaxID=151549 RepID=A0A4C1T0Z1_EUMVA|nr:hypothetical protein EVAR_78040_1 [Eumeta japonica]